MPQVDKEMMKQKVKCYGNNFPNIARQWNKYLKQDLKISNAQLKPWQVAYMMALMKKTRLLNQLNKDQYISDSSDYNNYKYISQNYEEYVNFTK